MTIKRVSDVITNYKDWTKGDVVTIKAGTGAGKSYFVKNTLYNHAKKNKKGKILMLVHRKNCLDQFQQEIEDEGKDDYITIATYQKLENLLLNGDNSDNEHLSDFAYIVADEFHYFMSDASFNKTTDLSLKLILEATNSVKILMSATSTDIKHYLKKYQNIESINYELPITFEHIKTLQFFHKDSGFDYYINLAIKNNRKGIFFFDSAKKAYELHKKYKEYSMFNCSSNNELYKHVEEDKIDKMLKEEKFDDLLLFTTTALDAGVNINDTELKDIVCDVVDPDTLLQCIGRKRLQDDKDYINLAIKSKTNQQLGGYINQANTKVKMADTLKEKGVKELLREFPRQFDTSGIIYDEWEDDTLTKKINELAYYKCKADAYKLRQMLDMGTFGYCEYIRKMLGHNIYTEVLDDENEKKTLEDYLDSIVGDVMLQIKDRKELIETLDVRQDGKLLRSLNSLNTALEETSHNYRIHSFETSRTVNGKKKNYKSAWRVMRLIDK